MARFILEDDDNLDFSNVNEMMPKGSAMAGTLEKAEPEKKANEEVKEEDKAESKVETKPEEVAVSEKTDVKAESSAEIKTEQPKAEKKTSEKKEAKSKKDVKKPAKKETTVSEETEISSESKSEIDVVTESAEEKAFPSFKEILYNEVAPGSEKEFVTIRLEPEIIAKLDMLTKELPKGKKSSRGQIISNLLSFFFDKYQKELDAMEFLSKLH